MKRIAAITTLYVVAAVALLSPLVALTANAEGVTDNDAGCDIGVFPAATLLLPYFEVEPESRYGRTTLFTVTNVTRLPQIAHVTIWTDWAFPVLDFNIFLTGYDTQSIDLYDVLVKGVIAPQGPGTSSTNTTISPRPNTPRTGTEHAMPARHTDNVHIDRTSVSAGGSCASLPGTIPQPLMGAVRAALQTGVYNPALENVTGCGNTRVGSRHHYLAGYATIDVVSNCTTRTPDDEDYYRFDLLYDNVLFGEYQQVDGDLVTGNFASGNSMVHIRAVPEGGRAGLPVPTKLPYTFYDRYTPRDRRTMDRRQPLPAQFAARWIEGGAGGFNTDYTFWREGVTGGPQSCNGADRNHDLPIGDIVRFDERENAYGYMGQVVCGCGPGYRPSSAALQKSNTSASPFPDNVGTDIAGWMYLDLNNGGSLAYSSAREGFDTAPTTVRPSQNWLTVTMYAQGRYSTSTDALMMGNGCSPAAPPYYGRAWEQLFIGPAANTTP